MGNLILTKSHKAANPYFAEKLGINLYTGEELSYFIYNYYMLLDDDFLEDRLFNFIERELEMAELSAKLRKWRGRVSYEELLLVILQDIHYYNSKELTEFYAKLEGMSKEGTENVIREKADYLVNMGHSYEGIHLYDRLLVGKSEKTLPEGFLATVHYNKAVALARIYANASAMKEFAKSWEIVPGDDALQSMVYLTFLDPELTLPEAVKKTVTEEQMADWREVFDEVKNRSIYHGKAMEVEAALELDDIKRPLRLEQLLADWKAEYIRCQG